MRRCLARSPRIYQSPFLINESLWKLPDDRNVRWSKYQCRSFSCLQKKRVQFDRDREAEMGNGYKHYLTPTPWRIFDHRHVECETRRRDPHRPRHQLRLE
ncbi:hypothetical protein ZOSMA_144G00370 [Zostera marina]|uniref:Uncharacterized protein n=1 Tax=Zostera marina TaxID=29655 RepID=A0A0K9PXF5_ZOSMR|nr:hypothetical protein ZOSMA_144G00370 [Zostera marina]